MSGTNISLRIADLPEEINLTEWWKAQSSNLPTLSKIAIPFIWVPVTSSKVERSFSQYANILSHDRVIRRKCTYFIYFKVEW